MLDLPISNLMARALLNEEEYFQFNDLQSLDSQLHRSLQQLKSFIHTNQTDSVEGTLFSLFPTYTIKMWFYIPRYTCRSILKTFERTIFGFQPSWISKY